MRLSHPLVAAARGEPMALAALVAAANEIGQLALVALDVSPPLAVLDALPLDVLRQESARDLGSALGLVAALLLVTVLEFEAALAFPLALLLLAERERDRAR